MNPRSALFVALVAAGFVYQPETPGVPPRPKESPLAPAAASTIVYDKELQVEDWPRETLHQFFTTRSVAREEAKQPVCPLPGTTQVDFLIATVPDPQNSHYPVMFDRFVESIRRASEDRHYALDRFWLPWEADTGPPDTDWLKREHHQDWQTRKQEYPGILVFRGEQESSDRRKVLGILLVGENPLTGINKQQFVNALLLIKHFKGPGAKDVQILGPTFSGSIHSLGISMLDLSADAGVSGYHVITGSATGSQNRETLRSYCGAEGKSDAPCKPDRPGITYDAAIENDLVAFNRFFSYLDPDFRAENSKGVHHDGLLHEVELNRVAILAESGSEYASQLLAAAKKDPSNLSRYLILHYPMEISRLRNAYEDDPELSVLSSNRMGGLPRQGLQIRLKDSHGSEDSLPSFSSELTPASQEAALVNTLSIISRERIEYVGIVASDILDAIFLGRMLKQNCPDVRLFIFDSDLAYGHVAQNYAFQGMLMVTSYPLFAANQRWTDSWNGQRQRRQFASASAQGVYNACLMLLNELRTRGDDKTPLVEYGPPFGDTNSAPSRPALWLTVVGRDGVWPLKALAWPNQAELRGLGVELSAKEEAQTPPANRASLELLEETSRGWVLGFWLFSLFCGLFAAAVYYFNLEPDNAKNVRRGRLSLFWVGSDEYSFGVKLCLNMAAGVLLIAYGFVAAAQLSYLSWNGRFRAEAVFCVLIPAFLLAAACWCWRPAKRSWMLARAACLLVALVFGVGVYARPFSLLYVYRIVHVNNGVTPIVPTVLLSMALFWYACTNLNRVRLCRSRPAGVPTFKDDIYLDGIQGLVADKIGGLEEAHASMVKALEQWWYGPWSMAAVAVLIVSLLLLEPWRVGSIETFPFEWPYTAGLCVLYAGLLFACGRFLHAWFDLRQILRMLERHPIREAFRRLPKELSPSVIWRWGGGQQSYLTLSHSIDRLRTLAERHGNHKFDRGSGFDYAAQLRVLEQGAKQLIAAAPTAQPIAGDAILCVHRVLIDVSSHLVKNVLMSHWSKGLTVELQPMAAAAAASSASASVSVQPPPVSPTNIALVEEFVALRFVALIRYATQHLKNVLEFAAGGLILAIVSLNSYPFEPHHSIITVISICFFALSAVFLTALVQMNRNTIVSYLNDTTPGKLDGDLLHVLSLGALPLITVVASQFPSLGRFIFSWVKPALETLR